MAQKQVVDRAGDWETSLAEYIESKRDEPFAYGVNDCCTFISGGVEAMCGYDPMVEFRGKYSTLAGSIRALRKIGKGDLEKTLDDKFMPIPIGQARRGDIAFFDGSAGIIAGRFAWFVSDDGLERIPLTYWEKAWRVG